MTDRTINGEVYERTMVLDRAAADNEARTVPAALSSEIEIDRWFGKELLVHESDAINLERAADGLPMLFNHNRDMPIGMIRDIRLDDDRRLRGVLHFSNNAKATEIWNDVRDGFLKDISIGYRIQKWEEESDSDLIRVTRWLLHEASVVTVPADHTVGINRSNEGGQTMPDTPNQGGGDSAHENDSLNVTEFRLNRERNLKEGKQEGMKAERKRISEIRNLFAPHMDRGDEYEELMNECIDKGVTVKRSTDALLEMLAGEHEPLARDFQQDEFNGTLDRQTTRDIGRASRDPKSHAIPRGGNGQDAVERFIEGAGQAIMVRSGIETDSKLVREIRANEFYSMRLPELAREYLRLTGTKVAGDQRTMVGMALTRDGFLPGHGTSDFSNLLENVASKALMMGYDEAPETWNIWCRVGSLSDFKTGSRVNLSTFGDLDLIPESGEYKYGTFSDKKETITLGTYGKLFNISRQAIINDDLDALSRIPMAMGRAANRMVGDLAYAILTGNPTMNEDATTLFHANHGNDVAAGSGAAPSVATVEAARTAMGTQTDPAGNTLNIRPAYLICPLALEGTSKTISTAQYDPAGTAGTLTPNTVAGTFETVADPRLDTADPLEWFMAANPQRHDTVEVAFLDGNQTPYMEQQDGWTVDGVSYKVRIDAAAGALDFRGLYRNDGN